MRLIDADVAQYIADKELFDDEAGAVQFVLSHTPTIDPESLRPKGEWYWLAYDANLKIGNWHCRRCNRIPKSHQKEDFCPNCGADMRGDK